MLKSGSIHIAGRGWHLSQLAGMTLDRQTVMRLYMVHLHQQRYQRTVVPMPTIYEEDDLP